jgi:hypothetical protein
MKSPELILGNVCVSCKHFDPGHNRCLRFPPVSLKFTNVRFDGYDRVEYEDNIWTYPTVDAESPRCGEWSPTVEWQIRKGRQ